MIHFYCTNIEKFVCQIVVGRQYCPLSLAVYMKNFRYVRSMQRKRRVRSIKKQKPSTLELENVLLKIYTCSNIIISEENSL